MKNEIITELGFTKDTVKINPVTGHIKIKVGYNSGHDGRLNRVCLRGRMDKLTSEFSRASMRTRFQSGCWLAASRQGRGK